MSLYNLGINESIFKTKIMTCYIVQIGQTKGLIVQQNEKKSNFRNDQDHKKRLNKKKTMSKMDYQSRIKAEKALNNIQLRESI